MKITVSNFSGYCKGVETTLMNAEKCIALAKEKSLPSYSIGNLIHNEHVVSYYSKKGLKVISNPNNNPKGIALVRAHGIPDDLRKDFENKGFNLIDSTCANIKVSLNAIKNAFDCGRKVVVIGLKNHDETKTLCGVRIDSEPAVSFELHDEKGLDTLFEKIPSEQKVSIVVQTTFSKALFDKLLSSLTEHYADLRVENSFCSECIKRKHDALELAQKCDVVLVVGSTNSANTKELANWLSENGKKVFLIEDSAHMSQDFIQSLKTYDNIGICSGTSSPLNIINDVVKALEESA